MSTFRMIGLLTISTPVVLPNPGKTDKTPGGTIIAEGRQDSIRAAQANQANLQPLQPSQQIQGQ
jgi:hypothetical protein